MQFSYTSSMYAENIAILKNFHKLYEHMRPYFHVPKFLHCNTTKPLVNLELPPLSHLYFMRIGRRGGFSRCTQSGTQLNAFDACFSERAARLSATARYE